MADLFPDIQQSKFILMKIFDKMKGHSGDYDRVIRDVLEFFKGVSDQSADIEFNAVIGNKTPSNLLGFGSKFLSTYFPGMTESQRLAYFSASFPGNASAFFGKWKGHDKDMRVSLSYNDTFIIIGLTNKQGGETNPKRIAHITIGRDPTYDARGQHGNPPDIQILKSIHLTDEKTQKHYFYTFEGTPINDIAKQLDTNIAATALANTPTTVNARAQGKVNVRAQKLTYIPPTPKVGSKRTRKSKQPKKRGTLKKGGRR